MGAPIAAASVGGPWGAALGASLHGLGSLKQTGSFSLPGMIMSGAASAGPNWLGGADRGPSYLKSMWSAERPWLGEMTKAVGSSPAVDYSIAEKLGSMVMTPEGAVGIGLGVMQYVAAKKEEAKEKGLGYTTEDYENDVAEYYAAYKANFEEGFAKGGIASLRKGGRAGYKHGSIDWFPWPSYKGHNELEEERYRDMSDKELEAILAKEKTHDNRKEETWLDFGLADLILDERKAKEIGGDYRSWFGGWRKNDAGLEMIDKLQEYKYGDKSKEDLIRDLENKWDEEIEEGYEPGHGGYFDDLWIFDKEDIPDKVNRGWDIAKGPVPDTGTAVGARGGIASLRKGGRAKYAFGRGPVLPELLEIQEEPPIGEILTETGIPVDEQVKGPGPGIEGISTEGIEGHTASSRIGDLMRLLEEAISQNNSDKANQIRSDLYREFGIQMKKGGRIRKAPGGLMNLGGMEKDYRTSGGFVPIGKKEKADDVPARLSKNEFVMTADAVRAAGGGNINKGAQKMYNTMKQLEGKRA